MSGPLTQLERIRDHHWKVARERVVAQRPASARTLGIPDYWVIDELHAEALELDLARTATAANWTRKCEVCGAFPVVEASGLCGPCTFGDASTAGGNW